MEKENDNRMFWIRTEEKILKKGISYNFDKNILLEFEKFLKMFEMILSNL